VVLVAAHCKEVGQRQHRGGDTASAIRLAIAASRNIDNFANAPPRYRDIEAAKSHTKAVRRFGSPGTHAPS
jgi:hypothetical protein